MGVEYDGSLFSGWQIQIDRRTVQAELERALSSVAGKRDIRVVGAGRTDAGVHAFGQVFHFDAPVAREPSAWVSGCNALTPEGITVNWAKFVKDDFHARFSALSRTYTYILLNRQTRPGIMAGRVGWDPKKLSVTKIEKSASFLIGNHDFSAFRNIQCQASTPVRHIFSITIRRQDSLVEMEFTANGFLHHMVRNIVGSLIEVGSGTKHPNWIRQVLNSRSRHEAGITFSPDGLILTNVGYDESWGIPSSNNSIMFFWGLKR